MDWFDEMLPHLPSPMPAADLTERICASLRTWERRKRVLRLSARLGLGMLFLGSLLLYLFGQEVLKAMGSDSTTLLLQVTSAFAQAVNAFLTSDLAQLSTIWTGVQEISLTAFSLILAFLATGLASLVLVQFAAFSDQDREQRAF